MSWSPLSSHCNRVASVTSDAFLLSLPALPDPSRSRGDLYLDACATLNSLRNKGEIDDVFFDYLCMHLNYAFAHGGA